MQCLPFAEFGVAEDGILNNLVSLVLGLHAGTFPLRLRGSDKIAQSWINERGLRIDVDDGRRRALQAQGKPPRRAEARAENDLWQILIARLMVRGKGALLVRGSGARRRAVAQSQLDRALQRQRLSHEHGYSHKKKQ